jgi:hypothetical protein
MKIHSDILTTQDLYRELHAPGVDGHVFLECMRVGSRKRAAGFDVGLEYLGDKVKGDGRHRSSRGGFGFDRPLAATWDEWGCWMDRLFTIDPAAIVGNYNGRDDFYAQTSRYLPRGMSAPWLAAAGIKRITRLERMGCSVNGNPRFSVGFDDATTAITSSDAGFCYGLTNPEYRDVPVRVTYTKAGRIADIATV